MMRARSTLDWSQSNNIYCYLLRVAESKVSFFSSHKNIRYSISVSLCKPSFQPNTSNYCRDHGYEASALPGVLVDVSAYTDTQSYLRRDG